MKAVATGGKCKNVTSEQVEHFAQPFLENVCNLRVFPLNGA